MNSRANFVCLCRQSDTLHTGEHATAEVQADLCALETLLAGCSAHVCQQVAPKPSTVTLAMTKATGRHAIGAASKSGIEACRLRGGGRGEQCRAVDHAYTASNQATKFHQTVSRDAHEMANTSRPTARSLHPDRFKDVSRGSKTDSGVHGSSGRAGSADVLTRGLRR